MKQDKARLIGSLFTWAACIICIYLLFTDMRSMTDLILMAVAGIAAVIGVILRYRKDVSSIVFYILAIIALAGVYISMYRGVSGNLDWIAFAILFALLIYQPKMPVQPRIPLQSGRSFAMQKTIYTNKEERRYTLMIEQMWMERFLHVKGNLHGLLKKGDSVVVLNEGAKGQRAIVRQILKNGEELSEAADTAVELVLDRLVRKPKQFSVISSVMPSEMPMEAQENPFLSGLMYEYGRFYKDENFRKIFFHTAEHSKFIVPVSLEQASDGPYTGMKIAFKGISRSDDTSIRSFALFTDREALTKWRALFDGGKAPMTMAITFHDACQIMLHGHNGMVINPFGPKFVYLSDEMVKQLIDDPQYQKEFGDPRTDKMSFERKGKKKK